MIEPRAIQEFYRYNRWANDQFIGAIANLTPNQFTRDLGSSYPSLRDTLVHIVWAEWIWLQRWKGISPQVAFLGSDFPVVDAVRAKWADIEREQLAFLDTVTPDRLLAVVPYVNLQGQTWQYPLWRQMYHVVNHSTYHRGQLTTMLRQLGAQTVSTDFLVFYDAQDV